MVILNIQPHKSRITLRSPILYSPKGKQYPSPNAVSPHPRAAAGAGDGENNSSLAAAAVPLRIRPPPRHQHRPMEAATVAGEGESQRNWDRWVIQLIQRNTYGMRRRPWRNYKRKKETSFFFSCIGTAFADQGDHEHQRWHISTLAQQNGAASAVSGPSPFITPTLTDLFIFLWFYIHYTS